MSGEPARFIDSWRADEAGMREVFLKRQNHLEDKPGGILGEDGGCSDRGEVDDALATCLQKRMDEAYSAAA